MKSDDLLAIAERAVEKALSYGAEDAEAFVYEKTLTEISIEGPLLNIREPHSIGIGIRVSKGKKVGFASASSIDYDVISNTVKIAVDLAKIIPEDKDFTKLPEAIKRPSKNGIIDSKLLNLPSDELLKVTSELVKDLYAYDPRIKSVFGGIHKYYEIFAIANSRGINDWAENAGIGGWVGGVARTEKEQKSGYDFVVGRKIPNFDKIVENAAKRTLECFNASPLKEKIEIPVIIENRPLAVLLSYMLSFGFSGRNVLMKSSYYTDKEEQKIASSNFTLIDDGQLLEGMNTTKVDHEGIPKTTNVLIDNGILKSFIHDTYSAYKLNKEPTGNASRSGSGTVEPFNNAVNIAFNNLVIPQGTKDFQSFIESFDEAVVVKTSLMGIGHANKETGDFSIVAPNVFLWKNKQLTPLKPVTLAGNFYKVLGNIIDIAGDAMILPSGKIPTIAFGKITIA